MIFFEYLYPAKKMKMKMKFIFIFLAGYESLSASPVMDAIIFIHGTIISRKDIPKLIFDFSSTAWEDIEKKRWNRDVETLRAIYGNKKGLSEITETNISKKIYNTVFIPFKKDFELYISRNNFYYTFNWSGSLLKEARKKASQELATAIIQLKKEHPSIKITVICHSHGGNVLLETADILKTTNISIDCAILLGTPISKKTEAWAAIKNKDKEYVFTKILNIFSQWDWVQPLDILSNDYAFCKKSFPISKTEKTNIINQKENIYSHWSFYYLLPFDPKPFIMEIPTILSKSEN